MKSTERGSITLNEPGLNFDTYHLFIGLVPRMIELARYSAAHNAISYRRFNVGAAIFTVDPELNRTGILSAGNRKMTPRCPKYCAEMNVIDQTEAAGFTEAIGIVVAGTANPEKIAEVTGKPTPTLHPCSHCLNRFESSKIIKPDTFVVTVGSDQETYQVHTAQELHELYRGMDSLTHGTQEAPAQSHSFDHWTERQAMYGLLTDPNAEGMGMQQLPQKEAARLALTAVLG